MYINMYTSIRLKIIIHRVRQKIQKRKQLSLALFATFCFLFFFYLYILKDLPNPHQLQNYKIIPISSQLLDRHGKLLFEIYRSENRIPIKLKTLPFYVAQATIAIEDKNFYKHGGISFFGGIARAIKDNIFQNRLQGGSTITQQLVKSALLTPDRTIRRKIREMILALWTEQIFTKDQILEMYLNQVPYGGSAYGIEEASRTYFGKKAENVSFTESAFLAGLPQAPSLYSPYTNPDRAENRMKEVIQQMCKQEYIQNVPGLSKKCATEDINKIIDYYGSPDVIPLTIPIKAPHFVFYIKSLLEQMYDAPTVEEGGLIVTTTLDLNLQEKAEDILSKELDKLKKLKVSNGALLITRPPTGEILAMLGSKDYFATPSGAFNVTIAYRQPGSSIKPLNYAVGIERKLVTPATVFLDMPVCFKTSNPKKPYCPHNYDGSFHGAVQLRFALGNSYNIPAVKMLAINKVADFTASSSAFLIDSFSDPERYGLSLTLGGAEIKMIEMNQAFSAFANQGIPKKLAPVLKITDKKGKTLYEYKDPNYVKDISKSLEYPNYTALNGTRAISKETAFLISHILLDNNARSAAFGSSSFLNIPKHAVSVKTGTTNDKRDNWTIGYTPNFLVTVWVGNNDNTPMDPYLTSGVTGAAPIWNAVMKELLKNQPDLWPKKPENIVGRNVCIISGALAIKTEDVSKNCPSRFEYFIKGTEPKQGESLKRLVPVSRDTGFLTRADDPSAEMQEKQIIQDAYSTYCIDCNHEAEPSAFIKL